MEKYAYLNDLTPSDTMSDEDVIVVGKKVVIDGKPRHQAKAVPAGELKSEMVALMLEEADMPSYVNEVKTLVVRAEDAVGDAVEAKDQVIAEVSKVQDAIADAETATNEAIAAAQALEDDVAVVLDAKDVTTQKASEATTAKNTATTQAGIATQKASEATTAKNTATSQASTATTQAGIAATKASQASQHEVAARGHAETAAEHANRAQNAAAAMTGAMIEMGGISLASGNLPPPYTDANGVKRSCFWKVTAGGTAGGITYGVNDSLVYSVHLSGFYKIDNTESVTSVNGRHGVITLAAADVGAYSIEQADDTFLKKGETAKNAEKLAGYGLTENATANTVAKRNSSGDLMARLFRSSQPDQTTVGGGLAFRINNGADNFIRFCSDKLAIRTWLDVYAKSEVLTKNGKAADSFKLEGKTKAQVIEESQNGMLTQAVADARYLVKTANAWINGSLGCLNEVTSKAGSSNANAHFWLARSDGRRAGLFYWDRGSDSVFLRKYGLDGSTIDNGLELKADYTQSTRPILQSAPQASDDHALTRRDWVVQQLAQRAPKANPALTGKTTITGDSEVISIKSGTGKSSYLKGYINNAAHWHFGKTATNSDNISLYSYIHKVTLAIQSGAVSSSHQFVIGSAAPTSANHATRKDYVDKQVATRLTKASADDYYAAKSHSHSYFPLGGGTVTGNATFNGNVNIQSSKLYIQGVAMLGANSSLCRVGDTGRKLQLQASGGNLTLAGTSQGEVRVYHAAFPPSLRDVAVERNARTGEASKTLDQLISDLVGRIEELEKRL